MRKIQLTGSHYEIGRQIGEILKQEEGYPPKYKHEVLEKSRGYKEQLKLFAPDLLEEFRGIADSLDIDFIVPLTFESTPHRFETTSCLVMAISGDHTEDGMPALARNHEWMESDSKNLRLCYTEPEGKLKSLGFTFHLPLVSRYGGINEAGVALSSSSASFENNGPGIMLNLATRQILDTCQTTEAAVAYLEKMPKVWGETYIIIDKNNTIAKVESHHEATKVTYSDAGFDWGTLLYDSPEMKQYMDQERIDHCKELTSDRKNFLSQWFEQNQGSINTKMIIEAMKNHENNVCCHGIEGLEICWSYILQPGTNKARVCAGPPCKNEYVTVNSP